VKKELNILLINDYPIIVEVYKKILLGTNKYILNLETCNSYDRTISIINSGTFDIIVIDLELISSENCMDISGEKLAILIRTKRPKIKIIVTISDNKPRIQNILKTIPHDALLIKRDITSEVILNTLERVFSNTPFYSKTVQNLIAQSTTGYVFLDEVNKKILYSLSKGIRTKNLIHYIPLSLSAIEKRKNNMKILFNVKSDEELLEKARERGFL
jgi:two-component system response regulator NreC